MSDPTSSARILFLSDFCGESTPPEEAMPVTLATLDETMARMAPRVSVRTGGKTVALKTIGLSVLMTQAGLPVPAAELVLPVFRQVRADIGDHQSIEADLSTYSAHIGAVAEYLGSTKAPALFLFDEIGTGTEPTEGAALARAILESLQQPGFTSVATTHLGPLKAWAVGREGVVSGSRNHHQLSVERHTRRRRARVIDRSNSV